MEVALITGFIVSIIFTFLSLVHFYWAFTGDMNNDIIIPKHNDEKLFAPSAFMTSMVAVGLLLFAFIVLGNVGVFEMASINSLFYYGTWAIGFIFLIRAIGDFKFVGFFKSINNTQFAYWDTRLYAPLCLTIAVLTFLTLFA